ncbi:MAG: hypothetical protein IT383_03645, partial [Deltaproteobacteria bacterium]|nr:hypothetical protein [Deltaproteobacteria bacterium]
MSCPFAGPYLPGNGTFGWATLTIDTAQGSVTQVVADATGLAGNELAICYNGGAT